MNRTSATLAARLACAALAAVASALAISGCGAGRTTALPNVAANQDAAHGSAPYPTALPHLYVDHAGTLSIYRLPLDAASKPFATLVEDPGSSIPPQIAVNAFGAIAIANSAELRLFKPPIVSFAPKYATLRLKYNGAITAVGPSGAELNDIEFDPEGNLWLVSNIGGEITELRRPIGPHSVAGVFVLFGVRNTKTAGFNNVGQARFDVNGTLYAYASNSIGSMLFKLAFPYAAQPSPFGIDLAQADFVDSSQYLPTNPDPAPLILGQYIGALHSPPPQQPPPPPVDELAQFEVPLNPVVGLFPSATVEQRVGALIADPPRVLFYALDAATGRLDVYRLPLTSGARPALSLACRGGSSRCSGKQEHLFLGP